jgi:uncharacterized membrane protein
VIGRLRNYLKLFWRDANMSGAIWGMIFGLTFFTPFYGMALGAATGALKR